jgi:hypothetical protein
MPLQRRLCGLLEVWHCPRIITPAFEVHGQLCGQLCDAVCIASLQPFPHVPVEHDLLGDTQSLVGHLLIEGMPKGIARGKRAVRPFDRSNRSQHTASPYQGRTTRVNLSDVSRQPCRHHGRSKLDPADTPGFDDPLLLLGQTIKLLGNHLA